MVAFYKHEITSWMDGTAGLSDHAYRAYHVICQMIYANEGPINLNERYIAGACNQSIKTFRVALKELVDGGKVSSSDGKIDNSRTAQELLLIENNRVNARAGGIGSGKTRQTKKKPSENKAPPEAPLQQGRSLRDETREEKTRLDETSKSAAPEAASPRRAPEPPPEEIAAPDVPVKPRPSPRRKSAAKANKKPPISRVAALLPQDWRPTTANNDYARRVGLSELEMAREAAKFRNHWHSHAETRADWNATWRNWCLKALEIMGRQPKSEDPEPPAAKVFDEATWKSILRIYASTNNWNPDLGPPPGQKGCRVPPNLLPTKQPELL